jgi:hypothetical protein
MTLGDGSMRGAGRLRTQVSTAQMARHCGHHRNRRPLCSFLRTSTGEQAHSGHGTVTNSGVSNKVFPGLGKSDLPGWRNQAGRMTHAVAWSATRPLASARPLHADTTEHLGCQRGHVQTLAGPGTVEHEGWRPGGVKSGEGRNTADTEVGCSQLTAGRR